MEKKTHKATERERREIMEELADQSHHIVFGTVPPRRCQSAVNPIHNYSRKIKREIKWKN